MRMVANSAAVAWMEPQQNNTNASTGSKRLNRFTRVMMREDYPILVFNIHRKS